MPNQRRTRYFTDQKLQGSLFATFLTLEILLLSASLIYLYLKYNQIIEAELFKIHAANNGLVVSEMLFELSKVIGLLLLANLVALGIAHFTWNRYVAKILNQFTTVLDSIGQLKLGPKSGITPLSHEVLDTLEQWRGIELRRSTSIRTICHQIDEPLLDDPAGRKALSERLKELRIHISADSKTQTPL